MKNVGPREGGSITAAQFIKRFIETASNGPISTSPAWSGRPRPARLGQGRDRLSACACSTGSSRTISRTSDRRRLLSARAPPARRGPAAAAERVLAAGERLLIVGRRGAARPSRRSAVDLRRRQSSCRTRVDGRYAATQPVLLTAEPVAANGADLLAIVDGRWRERGARLRPRASTCSTAATRRRRPRARAWRALGRATASSAATGARTSAGAGRRPREPCASSPARPIERRRYSHPSSWTNPEPGHGDRTDLFDHQARRDAPQPDRRGQPRCSRRPACASSLRKRLQLTRSRPRASTPSTASGRFFDDLVAFMISGPVVVQVLEGENAVARNREIMGATNPANADEGTIRKVLRRIDRGEHRPRLRQRRERRDRDRLLLQAGRDRRLAATFSSLRLERRPDGVGAGGHAVWIPDFAGTTGGAGPYEVAGLPQGVELAPGRCGLTGALDQRQAAQRHVGAARTGRRRSP